MDKDGEKGGRIRERHGGMEKDEGSGRGVEGWSGMEGQGEAWRDKEVCLGQYE